MCDGERATALCLSSCCLSFILVVLSPPSRFLRLTIVLRVFSERTGEEGESALPASGDQDSSRQVICNDSPSLADAQDDNTTYFVIVLRKTASSGSSNASSIASALLMSIYTIAVVLHPSQFYCFLYPIGMNGDSMIEGVKIRG